VFVAILGLLALHRVADRREPGLRTVLHVCTPLADGRAGESEASLLERIVGAISAHCSRMDLARVDSDARELNASLLIEVAGATPAGDLVASLRAALPEATVSLVDREALE
jgi:hypothetical protein